MPEAESLKPNSWTTEKPNYVFFKKTTSEQQKVLDLPKTPGTIEIMNKPKLAISFSGGRTSAVMTKLCVEKFKDSHDIAITFANTGCEHENTLRFVDQCDKHFGWGVVWLEAVVGGRGEGIRHKKFDFSTASRQGEPFEEYIKKHGLPAPSHPHCTSRLKEDVMTSYRKYELGWKDGTYDTAIGIRADEMDRMSAKRKEKRFVYPLADAGWKKEDVKRECASWPFDLDLKGEHYGNCVWCWKKSMRKLLTLAKDDPSNFDFPARMEREHRHTNITDPSIKDYRTMFRKNMGAVDILEMAKTTNFEPYEDIDQLDMGFNQPNYDVFLDTGSACGESCEIGADYE